VVTIIARAITDDLTSLVKAIDSKVGANKSKQMAAFVVFLSEDTDKLEPQLKALAKEKGIKNTPLTVMEGATGPPAYKIAKNAEVTVMLWVGGRVQANHAFTKGKLDKAAIDKIVEDTAKILK
jgi:hypothetical protein